LAHLTVALIRSGDFFGRSSSAPKQFLGKTVQLCRRRKLAFPYDQDVPPECEERARVFRVSAPIPSNFLMPVRSARPHLACAIDALSAPMPKAAMDE
jgi:hypothetical protein